MPLKFAFANLNLFHIWHFVLHNKSNKEVWITQIITIHDPYRHLKWHTTKKMNILSSFTKINLHYIDSLSWIIPLKSFVCVSQKKKVIWDAMIISMGGVSS